MKIYFANNQYLPIDNFSEEYRDGSRYLSFHLSQSKLSFDAIFNFINQKDILSRIVIVNDNNQVLATFNNIYTSMVLLQRNMVNDEDAYITVQLSTGQIDTSEVKN